MIRGYGWLGEETVIGSVQTVGAAEVGFFGKHWGLGLKKRFLDVFYLGLQIYFQ